MIFLNVSVECGVKHSLTVVMCHAVRQCGQVFADALAVSVTGMCL